jgi:hypothetical protein
MHVNYCPICQSSVGNLHLIREMVLGTRDEFLYFECSDCGCLSIVDVPEDLQRYYPHNCHGLKPRRLSRLRKLHNALYLSRFSFLINWREKKELDLIRRIHLKKNMSLLDVGDSFDSLLSDLRELGYDAHGVSLLVRSDVRDRYGVRTECKTLAEVTDKYDVILFRNSLEHMSINLLRIAREHLNKNGRCVVCTPIIGWGWQTYATDWAALDAPRHRFVHSRKSFSILAETSGFRIDKVILDSNEFQVWASNSYQRDIPLIDMPKPTRLQRNHLRRLTDALNLNNKGDTAQFYLQLA